MPEEAALVDPAAAARHRLTRRLATPRIVAEPRNLTLEVFRALADPVRLELLAQIAARGPLCVCHLQDDCPTASHGSRSIWARFAAPVSSRRAARERGSTTRSRRKRSRSRATSSTNSSTRSAPRTKPTTARRRSAPEVPPLAQALAAEAIGTFALVFAGAGAIMVDEKTGGSGQVGIALTFGLVIMAMIYAVGHISGAHFNPAVSFAFALTATSPGRRVGAYWAAQFSGALAAALAFAFLARRRGGRRCDASFRLGRSGLPMGDDPHLLLDVRDHGRRDRHASGRRGGRDRDRWHRRARRAFRRARSPGIDEPRPLRGARDCRCRLSDLWIYLTAPFLGAALGSLAYQFLRSEPTSR